MRRNSSLTGGYFDFDYDPHTRTETFEKKNPISILLDQITLHFIVVFNKIMQDAEQFFENF